MRSILAVALLLTSTLALADTIPTFMPNTCPTTFPVKNKVVCGTVMVPEVYNNSNSKLLPIDIAIIQSGKKDRKPLFYLEGGPGGNGLIPFEKQIFKVAKHRDLVLIAQRGTGFDSKINYSCDGFDVFGIQSAENMKKCRDSILQQGVNFQAMNPINSAEDINEVAKALHYPKVDLYGVSYGTYLALEVMKKHPEILNSVVLDSVIAPQVFPLMQAGPDGFITIQNMLNDCAIDTTCHEHYPNLPTEFFQLLDKIDKNPIHLTFPYAGQTQEVDVTISNLLDSISGNYEGIIYLPKAIHDLATNTATHYEFKEFGDAITQVFKPTILAPGQFKIATFWLTACQSLFSGENLSKIEFANQFLTSLPLQNFYNAYGKGELEICNIWFPANDELSPSKEAISSDVPTLILSGQYDGALDSTPATWAKSTAASLSHSYFYSFPRTGHGSLSAGKCPMRVMNEFLKDHTHHPDATCIKDMNKKREFVF